MQELEFLESAFAKVTFLSNLRKELNNEVYYDILRKLRYEYGIKERKIFNYGIKYI